MIGADVARHYRVVNHNARADDEQQYVGDTRQGVAACVDQLYVQADLKIVTGLVEPHFMAGYSGGRKVVCPGITSLKTIHTFHSPALLEDPRADNGVIEGNPCHEMSLEVARLAGVDFSVNVVIDENRLITGIFAGDLEAAHAASVEFANTIFKVGCPEVVDIVVTTNAGYPLDTTFYQAVKGMVGALPILQDGGTILCVSSLSEGIGSPEFTKLMFEMTDVDSFMKMILTPGFFVKDQWETEMLCRVLRKAEVYLFGEGLPAEDLARCMVTPITSVEEGLAKALAKHGPDARIAVIPPGPYLIPYVSGA
jgi:nickel-dependent lactate racemase